MTLEEISLSYRVAAEPLRRRLRELRQVAAVVQFSFSFFTTIC